MTACVVFQMGAPSSLGANSTFDGQASSALLLQDGGHDLPPVLAGVRQELQSAWSRVLGSVRGPQPAGDVSDRDVASPVPQDSDPTSPPQSTREASTAPTLAGGGHSADNSTASTMGEKSGPSVAGVLQGPDPASRSLQQQGIFNLPPTTMRHGRVQASGPGNPLKTLTPEETEQEIMSVSDPT